MQPTQKDLDFSDLAVDPRAYRQTRKAGKRELIIAICSLLLIVQVTAGEIVDNTASSLPVGLGLIVVVTLLALQISYFVRPLTNDYPALGEFAKRNGFNYMPDMHVDPQSVGTLFERLAMRHMKIGQMVQGEFHGLPYRLYQVEYDGTSRSQRLDCSTVMEFTLPRVLPDMIIDSRIAGGGSIVFDTNFIARRQKLTFEGDFNRYFDVYVPQNYEITALSIIAPNVMETLLEHAVRCDIEVYGNKVYFYWDGFLPTKSRYQQIFTAASAVLDKIQRKLTTGDIYTSAAQATSSQAPSAQLARAGFFRRNAGSLITASFLFAGMFAADFVLLMTNHDPLSAARVVTMFTYSAYGAIGIVIVIALLAARRDAKLLKRRSSEQDATNKKP